MADRFERLTNLLATLLDARRPLTLEEIIERVPGYPEEKASYRRQFERDKETLRGLGVPIEVEESAGAGTSAYRVDREIYELPDLDLTPDERAALHTAVTAMRLEGGEGHQALWKLGGLHGDDAPVLGALPAVPALPTLVDASQQRAPITFTHRGKLRTIEPWGVTFRSGNWYVVGHDIDRDEPRSFRADRIEDGVEVGEPGSFDRPDDFDPEQLLHDEPWRYGDEEPLEAVVAVDATVAPWVVRRVGDAAVREHRPDGGVVVALTVTNREAFRSFILGLLDHAEVVEPTELRDDLVAWLEAVAGVST